MDRKKFFDSVRDTVFGGHMSASQAHGLDTLLDACDAAGVTDPRQVAYVLATPMIETGGTFTPMVENLNYTAQALVSKFSDRISTADAARYGRTAQHAADQPAIANIIYGGSWGLKNLGNTTVGDGWYFRGRGLCQITGRRNYTKFGIDGAPDSAATLPVAARVMVVGMRDGVFTGKKLADYFSLSQAEWVNARKIINGLDRAEDVANFGRKFYIGVLAGS